MEYNTVHHSPFGYYRVMAHWISDINGPISFDYIITEL